MTEKILKVVEEVLKETYLHTVGSYDISDLHFDGDRVACVASAFRKYARKGVRKAMEPYRGRIRELPCRPGDYALLSNGSIVPVIYVTYTEDDIEIGCQNGIHVSMSGRSAYRCSGFYRTRQEAQEALERAGGMT